MRLRALVKEGFSGITVQLRRRADLIPNLVETVQGYAAHEREVFEEVTKARAASVNAGQRRGDRPGGRADDRDAWSAVCGRRGLSRAQGEHEFPAAAGPAVPIEGELQSARRYYNATVRDLNSSIQSFPAVLVARPLGFHEEPFYQDDDRPSRPRPRSHSPGPRPDDAFAHWRLFGRYSCLLRLRRMPRSASFASSATSRSSGIVARGHRDDRGRAEGDRDQPRHLSRFSDPLSRPQRRQVRVGFTCEDATLDGADPRRGSSRSPNGVRIKIGDPDRIVAPGEHSYVLRYRTTRQIGRFEGYDELYWNATGNGWVFPIDVAEARIRLPARSQVRSAVGLHRLEGSTATNAEVVAEKPGEIAFRTTQPLDSYEGLTVAVALPKGVVADAAKAAALRWWLADYGPPLVGAARPARPRAPSIIVAWRGPAAIRAPERSCRFSLLPTTSAPPRCAT